MLNPTTHLVKKEISYKEFVLLNWKNGASRNTLTAKHEYLKITQKFVDITENKNFNMHYVELLKTI